MDFTVEIATANRLAHQEQVAKRLERTGGEVIHPDHYDLRMAIRDAVLVAIDNAASDHNVASITDADLPALFRTLDAMAETLWLRSLS